MHWWICPPGTPSAPKKTYHRSLFLLGTILRFRCHDLHFVAALTLTAMSASFPCWLITRHPSKPPLPSFLLFPFSSKIWKYGNFLKIPYRLQLKGVKCISLA
jgi:hypothetical protein